MDTIGDSGFVYHKTMAQLWALLILELADKEILPFDFIVYAEAVRNYIGDHQTYARAKGPKDGLNLTLLHQAANEFTNYAADFHAWNRSWEEAVGQGYETSKLLQRPVTLLQIKCCVQTCVFAHRCQGLKVLE